VLDGQDEAVRGLTLATPNLSVNALACNANSPRHTKTLPPPERPIATS
jgi:hypothetical protein